MRRLRGTGFDPFGRTTVRRVERQLIAEYVELVEEILGALSPANHQVAVELARLPDVVRSSPAWPATGTAWPSCAPSSQPDLDGPWPEAEDWTD